MHFQVLAAIANLPAEAAVLLANYNSQLLLDLLTKADPKVQLSSCIPNLKLYHSSFSIKNFLPENSCFVTC